MTEDVTEEVMGGSGDEETPTSGVGTWLVVGLSLGVLLVLGIAIKRILKWFKKGKTLCLIVYLFKKYFLFQSKRKQ